MSAPALSSRSVSSERLMLPRSWSTPGACEAFSVFIKEVVVVRQFPQLRCQHAASLVPVKASKARVECSSAVASVA